ncbi:hypothetical protein U1Q18_040972 [Sarracenia purpurea var. burkii]
MSDSSSSSSWLPTLTFLTCVGTAIAAGSVFVFVRSVFTPADDKDDDEDANNSNAIAAIEGFDTNLGFGINRFRVKLSLRYHRIGGNSLHHMIIAAPVDLVVTGADSAPATLIVNGADSASSPGGC